MLKDLADVATIFGSMSLVISVFILIRELRETNRLARASNAQAMVEISGPFYLTMVQDRQLAELFARSAEGYAEMDEIDRRRYRRLLVWWLIFYENIFYQRKQRLLDRHTFKPWWRDLQIFLRDQNVSQHWEGLKPLFQEEFAEQVSELIAEEMQGLATRPVPHV
jgi:hypothetical protein